LQPTYGQEGLRVGIKAPDFELPAVGGKKIALREFQNKKIVIVHFWKSK
jgi:peroxiredoxin